MTTVRIIGEDLVEQGSFISAEDIVWLAEAGADEPLDRLGNRAIHFAAKYGSIAAINELIKLGADPTIENAPGQKASDVARAEGHIDAALFLRSYERKGQPATQLPRPQVAPASGPVGGFIPTNGTTINSGPEWTVPPELSGANIDVSLPTRPEHPAPERLSRVGDDEVSDQTFHQITIWLEHLKSIGREISLADFAKKQIKSWIRNGRIIAANLNDLGFTELNLTCAPGLKRLWCSGNKLTELDLNNVPELTSLSCRNNDLTRLTLTRTPKLTHLWCQDNNLTELNLLGAAGLTYLSCANNQLTEINLASTPRLNELWCNGNKLTTLDLKNVRRLTVLSCSNNHLVKLKLIHTPELNRVWCQDNKLTHLDLFGASGLIYLSCASNKLTEIDLTSSPIISEIWCSDNKLIKLELHNTRHLTALDCRNNQLTELNLTSCEELMHLVCDGKHLTQVYHRMQLWTDHAL